MALKEDYLDDILDTSVNEKRKYRMINNADGTISLEDVTEYSQNGDNFGAFDINITNKTVNELIAMGLNVRCNSNGYLEVKVDGEWEQTELKAIEYKTYLIKNGVLNDELITDFTTSNYNQQGTTTVSPTITTEGHSLKFNTTPTGGNKGGYHCNTTWTSNEIDVTNYSKLVIENLYYVAGIGGYNSNSSLKLENVGFSATNETGSTTIEEYDISSLTTTTLKAVASCFYATDGTKYPGYILVQNVWLE